MREYSFGEYLKSIRKSKGMTLTELGEKIGLTHSYISQIERGVKGTPSLETVKKITKALDVDYYEFLVSSGILPIDIELEIKETLNAKKELQAAIESYDRDIDAASKERIEAEQELNDACIACISESWELTDFLSFPQIKYKEKELTDQERQRILDMIALMFPDKKSQ